MLRAEMIDNLSRLRASLQEKRTQLLTKSLEEIKLQQDSEIRREKELWSQIMEEMKENGRDEREQNESVSRQAEFDQEMNRRRREHEEDRSAHHHIQTKSCLIV